MRSPVGSNQAQVKKRNRQALLLQLLRAPLPRVELARRLDLSPTTVTNLVTELLAEGWIIPEEESTFHHSGRGRPRTTLRLNPRAAAVIAVHIGIGTYRVARVDLLGRIDESRDATFHPADRASFVMDAIAATIGALNETASTILGIGFGASGLVDAVAGINHFAPSLGWHEIPIAMWLQERTGLPVAVENNVRAMALAETYFGHGREFDSLAFVYGRIGIGAGLVMNGRLLRGAAGGAGEIGHTAFIHENGLRCRCGQTGCLETIVTQPALARELRHLSRVATQNDDPLAQLDAILALARDGHRDATAALERITHYLGLAIANLVNTLNPALIVLGGMYAQGGDYFLPRLRRQVARDAFGPLGEQVRLETSAFGLDAGVVGAAALALLNFFYQTAPPVETNHSTKAEIAQEVI